MIEFIIECKVQRFPHDIFVPIYWTVIYQMISTQTWIYIHQEQMHHQVYWMKILCNLSNWLDPRKYINYLKNYHICCTFYDKNTFLKGHLIALTSRQPKSLVKNALTTELPLKKLFTLQKSTVESEITFE